MKPRAPKGYATVNPFIICHNASAAIAFVTEVFGATERTEARTLDTDGLLIHAEVALGDTIIAFGDRKPGWLFTPAFLQVWVDDIEDTLAKAMRKGAKIITEPTPFFGDQFSRFLDPWNNLWWVYQHASETDLSDATSWEETSFDDNASWEPTPELMYIHETLIEIMGSLADPQNS